jgi:hypothetical protein
MFICTRRRRRKTAARTDLSASSISVIAPLRIFYAGRTEWVVYAQRKPFAGPAQVLDYVGRYTHRVAISNNRLVSMDNQKVRFR